MRTRSRSKVIATYTYTGGTFPYSNVSCGGVTTGATLSLSGGTAVTEQRDERMLDDVGKGRDHYCLHRRRYFKRGTVPGSFIYGTSKAGPTYGVETVSGQGGYDYPNFSGTVPTYADFDLTSKSSFPPRWTIDWSNINESILKQDVIDSAKALKADVLLNIVEANQIWPSLKSLVTCIPEMKRNWKKIRKVVSTASGSYLAWKFGISPIISDLQSIAKYGPQISQDLTRFANGDNRRYSTKGLGKMVFNNAPVLGGIVNGFPTHRYDPQGLIQSNAVIRYVLVVKPNRPWKSDLMNKLDFLTTRFSTSPASLLWEKIPYSFVADWFVDIRGTLNELDTAIGFSPFTIVSFTKSVTYECSTQVPFTRISPCTGANIAPFNIVTAEFGHYERTPVSGLGGKPIWNPRFGKSQAGVSAALIAQQLARVGMRQK